MNKPARECGGCTLCCKLLPTKEIDKPANQRCQHQRHTGCSIYAKRPASCRLWSCRWLIGEDTAELRRPDRSRYVIDMLPDFITIVNDEIGERQHIEVVQIWCDPKTRDAWQDPALLDYIERRGREGKAALIRFSNREGCTVFPPCLTDDHQWHYRYSEALVKEHSFVEKAQVLASLHQQK